MLQKKRYHGMLRASDVRTRSTAEQAALDWLSEITYGILYTEMPHQLIIRKALKAVAKQKVAAILQPGNVWWIAPHPPSTEEMEEALRTCHLRGWIEPIANCIPRGKIEDGKLLKYFKDLTVEAYLGFYPIFHTTTKCVLAPKSCRYYEMITHIPISGFNVFITTWIIH